MCPICHNAEESLEHLFVSCPLARAVKFGIDLSIWIDAFALTNIRKWIQDWLSKLDLTDHKTLWFYGLFFFAHYGVYGYI